LHREWEHIQCKFISINEATSESASTQVFDEIASADHENEVYITNSIRFRKKITVQLEVDHLPVGINAQDVVLATGGGRGITAECCIKLGEKTGCSFLLAGRTSLNLGRFSKLKNIEESKMIQKSIRELLLASDDSVKPIDLLKIESWIKSVKEIESTISRLALLGCRVKYIPCDISQINSVIALKDTYANEWGEITAIIHGAGNLADKHIHRKTEEDLESVFNPKVVGLYNMIQVGIISERTKRLILFSSISSVFGNVGQSDYALANAILNRIAETIESQFENCKAIAICWGAWDTGMVDKSLRKRFRERGISLIKVDEGTEMFWKSLQLDQRHVINDKKSNMELRFKEHDYVN